MKTIFENDKIEIIDTERNYDFVYTIWNKTSHPLHLEFKEEENFDIYDWVGLFNSQTNYIDEIVKGNVAITELA